MVFDCTKLGINSDINESFLFFFEKEERIGECPDFPIFARLKKNQQLKYLKNCMEIKFKGKGLKRLVVVRTFFYLLQFDPFFKKPIPSANEMKYIRLIVAELQRLGLSYDVHCLLRDWACDERNGHRRRTKEEYRKAFGRIEGKWQRSLTERQRSEIFPYGENI